MKNIVPLPGGGLTSERQQAARVQLEDTSLSDATAPSKAGSIGLALSGGGFRAMLFHLGVLRYLAETGVLNQVRYITSVSGGSIVAAHLVLRWQDYIGGPDGFGSAARELFELARYDIRGRIIRRMPLFLGLKSTTDLFERALRRRLFGDELLKNMGSNGRPDLYILSTNSTRGCQAHFSHDSIQLEPSRKIRPGVCRLSLPVTASAAFPGFFPPLKLTRSRLHVDESELPYPEFFTDGGVCDNLGLRQLNELDAKSPVELKIVSNARARFDWQVQNRFSLFRNLLRSTDIMMDRIRSLEQEHADLLDAQDRRLKMVNIFDVGTGEYDLPENIQRGLPQIRTDFNCFTEEEINLLVCHGFSVARKMLGVAPGPPAWWPLGTRRDIAQERACEAKDAERLKKSCVRKVRLFDRRDWATWCYIAIVTCIGFFVLSVASPGLLPNWLAPAGIRLQDIMLAPFQGVKRSAMVGLWKGKIGWSPQWAPKLIGKLVLADPRSEGELTFVVAQDGTLHGTSHWQLINGTDAIAILIVEPTDMVLDEHGILSRFTMTSIKRAKIIDFEYGARAYYRMDFTERSPRELKGNMQCRDETTGEFEVVGDVILTKR